MLIRALILLLFSQISFAGALPVVKVGTLKSGTVHWELTVMQAQGLDRANGFELEIQPYANMSATRLAFTGGVVDAIVSDWLWAGKREAQGQKLWFVPYSKTIGSLMVPAASTRSWPEGLRGARIGVAGGPYSKGWILMQQAAADAGIDLKREATVKFAAPPLLNSELERGNLDMVVTFWHFGARLEAKGFRRLTDLETLTAAAGLDARMPMLGYLFDRAWVANNAAAARGFSEAVRQTKSLLASQSAVWQQVRPLMRAGDDATFETLRRGYLEGVPAALDNAQIESAQRFYQLIDQRRKQPSGQVLDAAMFSLRP